jgi:tetratricopeptide (TPR) repeat protein
MAENTLDKIEILLQQKKYSQAEILLKELLSKDPNDAHILSILAQIDLHFQKIESAKERIDTAIGIQPYVPFYYFVKAQILIFEKKYLESEYYLKKALELNPLDSESYAIWSFIKISQGEYSYAFELANKALELNPKNIQALNFRAIALVNLKNKEASKESFDAALKEDPNNPYTHANYGWKLYQIGDYEKGLDKFREALRINPNFEFAREGMVRTLKSKNFITKWLFRYSIWVGKVSRLQPIFFFGFFFLAKFLVHRRGEDKPINFYIYLFFGIFLVFVFSVWVATPMSNLFLRILLRGKYLLTRKEIMGSNLIAFGLLICLCGVLLYLFIMDIKYLTIAAFGFVMMIPCSAISITTKNDNLLLGFIITMTIIGLGAIIITFITGNFSNGLSWIFFLGFMVFQLFPEFLINKTDGV